MADTGNGATLTRSGFTVDIVKINLGGQTIGTLDKSLLSDQTWKKKVAEDLADAGSITVEYLFDAADTSELPAVGGTAVATTVTWPIHDSGNTTNSTLIGDAIITEVKPPDFANNELQMATVTMEFSGENGPSWTVESA